MQTTECISQVSTRRTGAAGLADFGSTSCTDRTGGDGVTGLAAGATGYTGATDIEEAGFADAGDVVGTEGPVAELVAFFADVDTCEGDDGAFNALWVDIGALAVDAETVNRQVGVVDVLQGLVALAGVTHFGPLGGLAGDTLRGIISAVGAAEVALEALRHCVDDGQEVAVHTLTSSTCEVEVGGGVAAGAVDGGN